MLLTKLNTLGNKHEVSLLKMYDIRSTRCHYLRRAYVNPGEERVFHLV